MTRFSASRTLLISGLVAAFLAGCTLNRNAERDEKKDPHYVTGKSRQQNMDYKGAAEAFEKAVEVNPQSASAHFELGLLYAGKLNDGVTNEETLDRNYAFGVYHLEKYLHLNPKSIWADNVREQIKACKYELAKTASFTLAPANFQHEMERLSSTNTFLRQQVAQLKLQLAQQAYAFSNHLANLPMQNTAAANVAQMRPLATNLRTNSAILPSRPTIAQPQAPVDRPDARSKSDTVPARSANVTAAQSYRIRSGDTLASIARRHGVALSALTATNPGLDPRKLKVGQMLNLPASRN